MPYRFALASSGGVGNAGLEKLGMRREGALRRHELFQKRWWDVSLYGILESEWRTPGP